MKLFSICLHPAFQGVKAFTKRGSQNDQIINDAIRYTVWGELDFLICDLPAGSGDELRAVLSRLENIIGMVIVTLPSTVDDFKRALDIAGRFHVPVLGVVENMVSVVCPYCAEEFNLYGSDWRTEIESICEDLELNYLGGVPYYPEFHQSGLKNGDIPNSFLETINGVIKVITQ